VSVFTDGIHGSQPAPETDRGVLTCSNGKKWSNRTAVAGGGKPKESGSKGNSKPSVMLTTAAAGVGAASSARPLSPTIQFWPLLVGVLHKSVAPNCHQVLLLLPCCCCHCDSLLMCLR
jgi:hypothetical protein